MSDNNLVFLPDRDTQGKVSIAEKRQSVSLSELQQGKICAVYFEMVVAGRYQTRCRLTHERGRYFLHEQLEMKVSGERSVPAIPGAKPSDTIKSGAQLLLGAGVNGVVGEILAVRRDKVRFEKAKAMTNGVAVAWPVRFEQQLSQLPYIREVG